MPQVEKEDSSCTRRAHSARVSHITVGPAVLGRWHSVTALVSVYSTEGSSKVAGCLLSKSLHFCWVPGRQEHWWPWQRGVAQSWLNPDVSGCELADKHRPWPLSTANAGVEEKMFQASGAYVEVGIRLWGSNFAVCHGLAFKPWLSYSSFCVLVFLLSSVNSISSQEF